MGPKSWAIAIYPQQMPLGWPKRLPKTAISENAIFLCQCHKVGPSIGVAAQLCSNSPGKWWRERCKMGVFSET